MLNILDSAKKNLFGGFDADLPLYVNVSDSKYWTENSRGKIISTETKHRNPRKIVA